MAAANADQPEWLPRASLSRLAMRAVRVPRVARLGTRDIRRRTVGVELNDSATREMVSRGASAGAVCS
jgi:hypothetical protein